MKLREKIFILFIALVYLIGQVGCATGRYEYPKPEPLSEEYRAQLGSIGVATGPDLPVIQFDRPLPTSQPGVLERMGRGASDGAEKTGGYMWDGCKKGWERPRGGAEIMGIFIYVAGLAVWCVLTVPVTIVGGLGGVIYGAFPSSSDYPAYTVTINYRVYSLREDMEETEALIRDTVANYPIQETFQGAFLKEARARTSHTFVVGPEHGPQTDKEMVGPGVDTVLELSVQRIWVKRVEDREGDMNPPMVLALIGRARLVRGTQKTVWYDQTFAHETEKRPYIYYNPYNGFQTDLQEAYQHLAKEMIEKLFFHTLSTSPEKEDTLAFFSETKLISQK